MVNWVGYTSVFSYALVGEIDLAVLSSGNVVQIQSCYSEHLAGAFCIGTGDDGSMNVYEVVLLEEFMDSISYQRSDSEYSAEGVCPGS